jgi:hypothetical protein
VIEGPLPIFMHYWTPSGPNEGRAYPLQVVPIGFFLDSSLFTAAWLALLALAPPRLLRFICFVRAHLRATRGLCTACGYDLTGLRATSCPECGGPASYS